jgi:Cellulase M and related proteins
MINLIKKITKCPAISGRERAVAEVIKQEIAPYADDVFYDALGNLIAFKAGSLSAGERKKFMFAGHMDEIGFIATYIEDNGFVRFATIGGISFASAAFTHVVFENGVRGVLVPEDGVGPNEYRADKFVVDLGTSTKKESERKIKIGDYFVVIPDVVKLAGTRLAGRPFDDRIGCVVMIETAMRVQKPAHDVYYVFTVQEEVGCRGARTAAFAIAPDFAIAYDVTRTGDAQSSKPMAVKLGGGAAIKILDSSVICDPELVETMKSIAKSNKIPYQMEILTAGGTDTSAMQSAGAGAKAAALSIPSRYIHSSVESIDTKDVEACISISCELIK